MSRELNFRYLNEEEMIEAGVSDIHECMDVMEDMFRLVYIGDYRMGGANANEHGIRVSFPVTSDIPGMPLAEPDKRFMAMPAYLGGNFRMFGVKTYGSNPHNSEKGLPRSVLMMSLLDPETGVPLAYMSANILSAMRTGATIGLGARHFCNDDADTIAIIGPGTMSRYATRAFIDARSNMSKIKIKGRSKAGIESFIDFCKKSFPQIKEYKICDTLEEACGGSDLIFYGTTNAAKFEDNPYVKREWLKPGCVVIGASALLVDTEFLCNSDVKLISDNYKMYDGWGAGNPIPTQRSVSTLLGMGFYDAVSEGRITRDMITDLGEILCGEKPGRDNKEQIILYAVGGMPIEDVAWAYKCLKNAEKKNIGTTLNLWRESAL